MDRARLWRAAPHLWGLAGAVVLAWAVLSSIGGFDGFTPKRHFISQLASPFNPHASRVNIGFIAGGSLIAIAMATLAFRLAPRRARMAALFAAGTGLATACVGVFPITAPVPHFGFAMLAGICAFIACVFLAGATIGKGRGTVAGILGCFIIAIIVSAITMAVHLVNVIADQRPGSLSEMLRIPPDRIYWDVGGSPINPFAVFEWFYFASVIVVFAAACVHGLRGTSRVEPTDLAQIDS
jgi:hypothetical membrane protein